ncbi:MAG: hypothetical protein Ct9H300mP8_02020 [Gammaproteobacteria bacterium]|nr:MAG: hypothetical protein Ct9H300mP8_02020 [Gammaproteobacteria bacterium]
MVAAACFKPPCLGKRPTSKQAALGLCEMPADFINAYILGSVGSTGAVIGRVRHSYITSNKGSTNPQWSSTRSDGWGAEAPITPGIVEGYRIMGALTEDEALMALDGINEVDNRRACRPFSDNAGFTLAEAAIYVVLMDDPLASTWRRNIWLGTRRLHQRRRIQEIHPQSGIGNYVTMAKAMATARRCWR